MIGYARLALSVLAAGCLAAVAEQPSNPVSDLAAALRVPGTLQSRIRFDHLTSADGLSHDSVFAILRDHYGFLWLGTQAGLNRYDGYKVTQFRHDPRDLNSIGDDFIMFLLEDSRGGIWTGTRSLSRFDPATAKFTHFALPSSELTTYDPTPSWKLAEDLSGFLWVGLGSGRTLYRLDPGTGNVRGFDISGNLAPGMESPINGIVKDRDGILWLGTSNGLVRFDPRSGAATRYPQDRPNPQPGRVAINALAQDRAGNFWLATDEGPRNFFDPRTGIFDRRWAVPDSQSPGAASNREILAGDDGVLWLGTTSGLKLVDPSTGASAILRHDAADAHSLSANDILSIAKDRDGTLWIGVKGGGVNRFSPGSLRFGAWRHDPDDANSLSDENIRAIHRDRAGIVWMGTYDGGLNRLDPLTGRFTHFRHDPRDPTSLDSDRVYSIYEDRSGNLWVGTVVGINRLDRTSGSFTRFARGKVPPGAPTYSLLEDRRGGFWFGGGGAYMLDRQTGTVKNVARLGGLSMYEDRHGTLWFQSGTGLSRVDAFGHIRAIALPYSVNYIREDEGETLWLATETGLLRFDPNSEAYTSFTTREGLPDNVVQCILPDQAGNLWISTNNGISRFNPRENTFSNYYESDGLQGNQFNRKACFVDPSGVMYFGGLHGFNMFDPRRIAAAPRETPRVVLTDFLIHGSTVPVRPGSVLPKPVWQMDELNLPPEDNGFSFEFAALTYSGQARTRYRFTLEGLETRWTEVDSRSRSARYTGLRPGNYRFRVQASTDGRNWSSQEAAIGISITPPWWMTWWSLGGMVLAISGLLFGAYKLRVRALHERRVRLEKLVEQRTEELVEARNQAEQARQLAEQANRTKSVFLANMSHELRTPLNAILGFSNILRERVASQDQRRDLDIINRSGEHLLTLINDVLDVARIEAGRVELDVAACDLRGLVKDVLDMMRMRAEEKLLQLTLTESPEVPRYVLTDAAKLREVLINLLGNAVKYTEQGSIMMRTSAQPAGSGGQVRLRFEVEDTGIGIAAADQERIFEPFEQLAKTGKQKGTGLGLAITRQVVVLMGGKIEVQSTPGIGSCFRVEIPVELAEEVPSKPAAGRERILGLEPGQPECRILVVEDEPENWMVLDRLLQEAGFQVRVAENGEQGVERFREWQPHFIWMDLRMPVMDGIEATRRIRQLEGGRDVKIAAVTASGYVGGRNHAWAAGLDDYVTKPYRPDEIFECMQRHLGVLYRREEAVPQSAGEPQAELRADAIAALPVEVRTDLRDAVLTLSRERIAEAIAQVAERDTMLAAMLARCAESFQYTAILNAVDGGSEDLTDTSA